MQQQPGPRDARGLTPCGALLRRGDPDRYLTVLAGPRRQAEALFALYAFNLELARTAEVVREPLLGEIRLQWWRDALAPEAAPRHHPVTDALAPLLAAGALQADELLALVEARERDLDKAPPPDMSAFLRYCDETAGTLNALAARLTGASAAAQERARKIGRAWAILGLLRATAHLAGQGRVMLPLTLLQAAGLGPRTLLDLTPHPGLAEIGRHLDREAGELLAEGAGRERSAPFLLARLARRYRRHLARLDFELLHPRAAERPPGLAWSLILPRWR